MNEAVQDFDKVQVWKSLEDWNWLKMLWKNKRAKQVWGSHLYDLDIRRHHVKIGDLQMLIHIDGRYIHHFNTWEQINHGLTGANEPLP